MAAGDRHGNKGAPVIFGPTQNSQRGSLGFDDDHRNARVAKPFGIHGCNKRVLTAKSCLVLALRLSVRVDFWIVLTDGVRHRVRGVIAIEWEKESDRYTGKRSGGTSRDVWKIAAGVHYVAVLRALKRLRFNPVWPETLQFLLHPALQEKWLPVGAPEAIVAFGLNGCGGQI